MFNEILREFRKAHTTQHTLFELLASWQKSLDEAEFVYKWFYEWFAYNSMKVNPDKSKSITQGLWNAMTALCHDPIDTKILCCNKLIRC